MIHEWDLPVATFNKHKYEVTDATDKEFVEIHIYHDNNFNYYMDQTRMISVILVEVYQFRLTDRPTSASWSIG